jgi:hypothetical protein
VPWEDVRIAQIECISGTICTFLDLQLFEIKDMIKPPCSIMQESWRIPGIKRVKGNIVHTLNLLLLEITVQA